MKFSIKLVLIETELKPNYFVLQNNEILQVKSIDITNKKVTLTNQEECEIDLIKKSVVKFIGTYKHQTYSIVHGDFNTIVDFLYNDVEYSETTKEEDKKYIQYKDVLIDNKEIELHGVFEKILTKTLINDSILINNLDIIDKLEIYDKSDRIGVVNKFDNKLHKFTIKLNNGETIICNREDFKKLENRNEIYMIRLLCSNCGK